MLLGPQVMRLVVIPARPLPSLKVASCQLPVKPSAPTEEYQANCTTASGLSRHSNNYMFYRPLATWLYENPPNWPSANTEDGIQNLFEVQMSMSISSADPRSRYQVARTGTTPVHVPLLLSSQYPSFPCFNFQTTSSPFSTRVNHRGFHSSPCVSISRRRSL